MTEPEIKDLIARQRAHYATGATLSRKARMASLKALRQGMKRHEAELFEALRLDLGKSETESYMCEVGLTYSEISWMESHLRGLMRENLVWTPLAHFSSTSYRSPQPYGTVLIVSPWNYPVLLMLEPLIDALAAGNTVILKPSAYAPHCADVMQRIIAECFPEELVAVVKGGRAENQALLRQKFDFIFFTGGKTVGREVLRQAAEHLTPVVLELGGKSSVIIDESADVRLAARRIAFGKYLNCGQTCVAPDYVLCHESLHDRFVEAIKQEIANMYGMQPLDNKAYGKIINQKHFDRLCGLIEAYKAQRSADVSVASQRPAPGGSVASQRPAPGGSVAGLYGGQTQPDALRIAPTVLDGVTEDDAVMQEEIFGPILPVLTYKSLDEAIRFVTARPHPLALYLFTSRSSVKREVKARCHFGGGCINDTIIHLATSEMPFGGVGESGMGCYHGRAGFEAFSHCRSIVDKHTWLDLPIRYQPYASWKDRLLKLFLK